LSAVSDAAEVVAVACACDALERSHGGVESCAGAIGGCFGEVGAAEGCGWNSFSTALPAVS
jgi:hypothetical protein